MEEKIERFLDFVREKGGASAVAKKVGKHPQFIYNIEQGKGKPNFETLTMMKEAYPDLDLNWVFTGEKTQVPADNKENEYLKRENSLLRALAEAKGVSFPKRKGVTVKSPKLDELMKRYKSEKPNYLTLAFAYINPN